MKAHSVARGGLMTGVSMLLLGLGTLFEIAGGAAALLAALVPAFFYLRGDGRTGLLVYIATAVLAILLLPDKFVSLVYALVLGLYTVLKFAIDKHRKLTRLVCKALVVVLWVALSMALVKLGLIAELKALSPFVILALLAGWTAFLLYYDFCLSRIFTGIRRLANRYHFP